MVKSFCIHRQNIQRLLIKIYRALNYISGSNFTLLLRGECENMNLRSKQKLISNSVYNALKVKNSLRSFSLSNLVLITNLN